MSKTYKIKNFKNNTFLSIIRVQSNKRRALKTTLDLKKKHKCSNCNKKTICFTTLNTYSNDNLCLICISKILNKRVCKK